jgi:hypothetical protein
MGGGETMNSPTIATPSSHRLQRTGVHLVYSRPGRHGSVVEYRFLPRPRPHIIGSASEADIRLSDRFVSRRHLRLDWYQERLFAEDLHSTNGTTLNGLALTGRRLLETPSLMGIGLLQLLVLDACPWGHTEGVSLGPIVGPAGELLPVLHRFLVGTVAGGAVGDFYRRVAAALLLTPGEGGAAHGLLRHLTPESSFAVRRAHG